MYDRNLRLESGITTAELVEKMKAKYPKINKSVVSFVENGAEYGVMFTPEADKLAISCLIRRE